MTAAEVTFGDQPDSASFEQAVYHGKCLTSPSGPNHPLGVSDRSPLQQEPQRVPNLSKEDQLIIKLISAARESQELIPERSALLYARASALVLAAGQRFQVEGLEPDSYKQQWVQFEEWLRPIFKHVIDLSLDGNPLAKGLAAAQKLLLAGEIDYAILAGACSSPEIEKVILKAGIRISPEADLFGFDRRREGWGFAQGGAAVLLMTSEMADKMCLQPLAILTGIGYAAREGSNPKKHIIPTFVSAETVFQSCQQAFSQANIQPENVGYLETLASGFSPLDSAEIGGLAKAYHQVGANMTCALGSVLLQGGFLPAAAGIAGLARAATCLSRRFLPATPTWEGPKKAELFAGTPFYVANEPRSWFLSQGLNARCAAVSTLGWDGSSAHILLAEAHPSRPFPNHFIDQPGISLIPIAANSVEQILTSLRQLKARLEHLPMRAAVMEAFRSFRTQAESTYCACLVAQNQVDLLKEIETALRDLPTSFDKKKPWQTLAGSYFNPDPVGRNGGIAFVYPGAFNSYAGLGRDLFTLFPQLLDSAVQLTTDIPATLQERQLYPRSLEALNKDQLTAFEAQLTSDPIAMITSGSMISILFTTILRDIFQVHPAQALGYSLGELAMLFASGIWDQADGVRARLHASPLFTERLSGPQNAIREYWQQPAAEGHGLLWANYFLMAPADAVKGILKNHKRVHLTHINTPRQVVIGGDPRECQQVIAELKCNSLRAPFDFALHCEAMASEYHLLEEMLTWPVAVHPQTRLYTAAGMAPLPLESQPIAEKISTMLCSSLDFPSLVRQAYKDGARIFIELGANANCTKWIEDILKGEPICAAAVNRRGVDDLTSLVRVLARLVSNRVPLNLEPLYSNNPADNR